MGHTHLFFSYCVRFLRRCTYSCFFLGIIFGQTCLICLSFDMTYIHYLSHGCCGTVKHIQDKGILCQRANYQWNPFASLLYLICRVFGSELLLCFAVKSPNITDSVLTDRFTNYACCCTLFGLLWFGASFLRWCFQKYSWFLCCWSNWFVLLWFQG